MELIKKNIHIDREKCRASTQLTLDDDFNVPDSKPDIFKLILEKSDVKIDEMKVSDGHVSVKGGLAFHVLYLSDGAEKSVQSLSGSISFEELIHTDGVESTNEARLTPYVENLRISAINSRKLSIQAIVTLKLSVSEIYEEPAAVEIDGGLPVEYRKKGLDIVELALEKKDIFRIKDEFELPSNLPNIFEILWSDIRFENTELRAVEQKLSVQGEIVVFLLYEGEGDDASVRWYETKIPFHGSMDCAGCREDMIADISWSAGHVELEPKPDYDGEERSVALDMVLDLDIRLYEEEHVEILADVYGVSREIEARTRPGIFKNLLMKNNALCRESERLRIKGNDARILQLVHCEGNAVIDSVETVENGIQVSGALEVQILYVSTDDSMPFFSMRDTIPFEQLLEIPGMDKGCSYYLQHSVEQIAATMIDSEEIEVKAAVKLLLMVFTQWEEEVVEDIGVSELDLEKLKNLPGIVGYIAREGDTLWQIGKKYYVSVEQIKAANALTSEELRAGDKLLIVKTLAQ